MRRGDLLTMDPPHHDVGRPDLAVFPICSHHQFINQISNLAKIICGTKLWLYQGFFWPAGIFTISQSSSVKKCQFIFVVVAVGLLTCEWNIISCICRAVKNWSRCVKNTPVFHLLGLCNVSMYCTYSGCAKIENKNKHGFEKPEYVLFQCCGARAGGAQIILRNWSRNWSHN